MVWCLVKAQGYIYLTFCYYVRKVRQEHNKNDEPGYLNQYNDQVTVQTTGVQFPAGAMTKFSSPPRPEKVSGPDILLCMPRPVSQGGKAAATRS